MSEQGRLVLSERITQSIFLIRDQKVMLDEDLARLYGVETRTLIQAVKRHQDRFPRDFMFRLTKSEEQRLRSQIVISNDQTGGRGGRRYAPYVFTEQGVAMLSSVLNSPRAIRVNIEIMRAFVQLRQLMRTDEDLACRFDDLEQRFDRQFRIVFDAIRQPLAPPHTPRRRIGFQQNADGPSQGGGCGAPDRSTPS